MKVEIPQILWHSQGSSASKSEAGKNAPIYSLDLLTRAAGSPDKSEHVLATAGNTSDINLWTLEFADIVGDGQQKSCGEKVGPGGSSECCTSPRRGRFRKNILQTTLGGRGQHNHSSNKNENGDSDANSALKETSIRHIITLSRHERSVNCLAFSPDGLHLATAGDGGSILVWSLPISVQDEDRSHYWSNLSAERDLKCRIVSSQCEDAMDISWSADSKRFVVGTLDHCLLLFENTSHQTNPTPTINKPLQLQATWKCVYRNHTDHMHYVQGVAYDPLGAYIATQGSDRTVRVYPRKIPASLRKNPHTAPQTHDDTTPPKPTNLADVNSQTLRHIKNISATHTLADAKVLLAKSKLIKYRSAGLDGDTTDPTNDDIAKNTTQSKKHYLYADESTMESFFRRLSWTPDGAFLITPAALCPRISANGHSTGDALTFATCLFARHQYDTPYKILGGLEKPSVAVRPNPVLFHLPQSKKSTSLPYRSIFAVLTVDSVLIYDTHHDLPLSIARGLHCAGLTDATWSTDGHHLLVSSSDGYVSIFTFRPGELGAQYRLPSHFLDDQKSTTEANPAKQMKKTISPTLVLPQISSPSPSLEEKNEQPLRSDKSASAIPLSALDPFQAERKNLTGTEEQMPHVSKTHSATSGHNETKLSLSEQDQPRKKRRIQPTLISCSQ